MFESIIHSLEGRLFVAVKHPSVAVQNDNAFFFSRDAVAAVDTMVRTIVPVAGEGKYHLWVNTHLLQRL